MRAIGLAVDAFFLLSLVSLAVCIPSWADGFVTPRTSIGSLVPGASLIEALGAGISYEQYRPKYLSINAEKGMAGPMMIRENLAPPLFFINNQQLWQLNNQSSILSVNLVNVTGVAGEPAPLKLEVSEKSGGIQGGEWRWRGTMLFYDLGSLSNTGVWLTCQQKGAKPGVYTSLTPAPAPDGCRFTTLHSFVNRVERP